MCAFVPLQIMFKAKVFIRWTWALLCFGCMKVQALAQVAYSTYEMLLGISPSWQIAVLVYFPGG
jgi:hypothetical protein